MKRWNINNKVLIDGKYYDQEEFLNNIWVDGIIRIQKNEWDFIDRAQNIIDHFNLQVSYHKAWKKYALIKINKPWFYTKEKEQLPDLSWKDIIITECIMVKEKLSYDDLKDYNFTYSFKNIKSIDELKKAIIARYSISMPELSNEEILEKWVSLTRLQQI